MTKKKYDRELEERELEEVAGGLKTRVFTGEVGTAGAKEVPPADPEPKVVNWKATEIVEKPRRIK